MLLDLIRSRAAIQTPTVFTAANPGMPAGGFVGESKATILAAYEVSAVMRPNLLLDVSAEWETVLSAAEAYASQLEVHPYIVPHDPLAGCAAAGVSTMIPSL